MDSDEKLHVFVNFLGLVIVTMIVLYHYMTAPQAIKNM
jgi:Oligosaccaryltransferase